MNYSTRNKNKIVKFVVIHYTGMKDFISAYRRLSSMNSDVSCHYLISRRGNIYNLLPPHLKAWHAGKSHWKGHTNINDYSIGIELENKGHDHGYQSFTKAQYDSLNRLLKSLKFFYFSLKKSSIIGHSDISPIRKIDPGNKFKWNLLHLK